jgi:hypothetical protein
MLRPTALLLLASAGAALACPPPLLVDVPLTKDGTAIPAGGGVVMATVNARGGGIAENGGRLLAGRVDVVMTREYLAPGLSVIVPKAQANRAIELVGDSGATLLHLTQTAVAPKHAAPKIAKVHSTAPPVKKTNGPPRFEMYEASSQLTIELAEAPPDAVLALVVCLGNPGVAWAAPRPKQTAYSFWAGGKRCVPGPGTVPQGSAVTLGYVDLSGRVSVLTRAIRVGATPVPKPGR